MIRAVSSNRIRLNGLILVAIGVLFVFFTGCVPDEGITGVGITERETVAAGIPPPPPECDDCSSGAGLYESSDGGLSWIPKSISAQDVEWGTEHVVTPRGEYTVQDARIVVDLTNREEETVYSAEFLGKNANLWVQNEATKHLALRELAARPSRSIVYHEPTGNLVVAMGLEGVVVGAPDGEWSRLAVGPYGPTDYSFTGKVRQAALSGRLWAAAIGLSVSLTAIILVLHQKGENRPGIVIVGALAPLVLVSVLGQV